MAKTVKHDARKGQGAGARGGSTRKPFGGIAASTRGSRTATLTLTTQGAQPSLTGQESAHGAAPSRTSARLAAAQGQRRPSGPARDPRRPSDPAQTPKTRESRAGAGQKPASARRKSHSCATTTIGDFVNAARQGAAGLKTSGAIASRTRAAIRSVAFGSKGTADVSSSNQFAVLRDLTEEARALTHAPRRSKRIRFPHLTDADATAASVASGNKRARTWSELTRSSSAPQR